MYCIIHKLFFLFLAWTACLLCSKEKPIVITNPGFEEMNPANGIQSWTWTSKESSGVDSQVQVSQQMPHTGKNCLQIQHTNWTQSTLVSQPVRLTIGHVYKLSGWLKTNAAKTDPSDRYPTSVAGCLTMASFPFTNHSPALGGSNDWKKIAMYFVATQSVDRLQLHFGYNGRAIGEVYFDDLDLIEPDHLAGYIPNERVHWYGPAFTYSEGGWTFLHIEGRAYDRGFQHGHLLAKDIVAYMEKLAILANSDKPMNGWEQLVLMSDSLMLRKFDAEYLEEMKGIADGVNQAKAAFQFKNGPLDLYDIVAVNAAVEMPQIGSAMSRTSHPLSGKTFLSAEEEQKTSERLHKCSGFLANQSVTQSGGIVFSQMFMWSGYTGVHWNIICDIVPEHGQRLVYETFPGGIHSGADFYINQTGMMVGETTVQQTPFELNGIPVANRIRKAVQYAHSIDQIVQILTTGNNGLYTNDWLIADCKTNEIAILLLGTKKYKIWRSRSGEFPGGTTDFYWSVNTAKDLDIRKELIPNPRNTPIDIIYSPVNRDHSFYRYYQEFKGQINVINGARIMASSPINRPHACDGKITSSEMAKSMVFWAHYGKVTSREKFPGEHPRFAPLPGAVPHLTLGYTAFSPIFITEKLKQKHEQDNNLKFVTDSPKKEWILPKIPDIYTFTQKQLWHNTICPASDKENWLISGAAAYWNILDKMPLEPQGAIFYLANQLSEINCRLQYVTAKEGPVNALQAKQVYDRFAFYLVPRIRGTFLFHQLRLFMGNDSFSKLMNKIHNQFQNKPIQNSQFLRLLNQYHGKNWPAIFRQWLERSDLPDPKIRAKVGQTPEGNWELLLTVEQLESNFFHLITTVSVETEKKTYWHRIEIDQPQKTITIPMVEKPLQLVFNAGNDFPMIRQDFYTFTNISDDFTSLSIAYGTMRKIESQHTLGLKYQSLLADISWEILPPLGKDSEVSETEFANHDWILIGGPQDNLLLAAIQDKLNFQAGRDYFVWNKQTYADDNDGLIAVFPNPKNPQRIIYLVMANSALQLYQMVKAYQPIPSWGLFKGDKLVDKGFHNKKDFIISFN